MFMLVPNCFPHCNICRNIRQGPKPENIDLSKHLSSVYIKIYAFKSVDGRQREYFILVFNRGKKERQERKRREKKKEA